MSELNKPLNRKVKKKEELSLGEIFRIIKKRKYILILSVIVLTVSAFVFSKLTKPIYESAVLLKKDKSNREKSDQESLRDIMLMQSQDEIETEMELVKTREVLNKVIENLSLLVTIDKVTDSEGNSTGYNSSAVDYMRKSLQEKTYPGLPLFLNVKRSNSQQKYNYYIKKLDEHSFGIFNPADNSLLQKVSDKPLLVNEDSADAAQSDSSFLSEEYDLPPGQSHSFVSFNLSGNRIVVDWTGGATGKSIYFHLNGYFETLENLIKNITIEHVVKTDIFRIAVQNTSPFLAQLIANKISEEYRGIRINQQKETIRYSYKFVDKQLQDVWGKLKASEMELSKYKSANQITSIDENSKSLVNFLSSLEAEKIKTNLELAENGSKLSQMQNELKNKGYIDETYLTPHATEQSNSPFSNLLKQLSDLEIQRIELMQRRKETHPDVEMVDRRIKQIKDKLLIYNQNTLSAYQIIISSAKKKQEQLDSLTSKYAGRVESLPAEESRLAELIRQKNVYDKIFAMLLNQREQMRMAELTKLQDIIIVDQAHLPVKPIYPKTILNIIIGFLAGIIIGFAAIIIREIIDRKYIDLEEIENDFDTPIYAIIPSYPKSIKKRITESNLFSDRFVALMSDQDGFRESYRVLRAKINSRIHKNTNILMLTSCEENTGKTSIVANLGITLANANKRVLLVDFDLKKATLTRSLYFKADSPGLITFLENDLLAPSIHSLPLGPNVDTTTCILDILPAGGISEKSGDLISTYKMKRLMEYIKTSSYDYVLVDTPPVTRVSDVLTIGKYIKNSLLVIRPNWTFRDGLLWGIKEMEQGNIHIHGIVINACDIKRSTFRYRYGYGYGYAPYKDYKAKAL